MHDNMLDILAKDVDTARTALNQAKEERSKFLDSMTDDKFDETNQKTAEEHNTAVTSALSKLSAANKAYADGKREQDEYDAQQAAAQKIHEDLQQRFASKNSDGSIAKVDEKNPVYRKDDSKTSYFRDLFNSQRGNHAAIDRLTRSQESRAIDTTGAGTFAPPLWLVQDFIALARPGRITADLLNKQTLPAGVSSVNLPQVTQGTIIGLQSTQNTALASQDLKSGAVSSGITTVGGEVTISLQLLEQSGIPFDQVILQDLAAAHAAYTDTQVISGTGADSQLRGILSVVPAANQVSLTSTTVAKFFSAVNDAIQRISTSRFLPPTVIIMHPRRWAWLLAQTDGNGRPLVVPNGAAFNQMAVTTPGPDAQGIAGTLAGLPVQLDPNIPTTLGGTTGSNPTPGTQDVVLVLRASDLWLWETALQTAAFDATYANQASMLYRVLSYAAMIPDRYPASIATIGGAGLVTPTF